ncbi:unnamed protein product, partial [Auanema sp. JU1783]
VLIDEKISPVVDSFGAIGSSDSDVSILSHTFEVTIKAVQECIAVLSVLYFQQTSAVTYCNTVNIQAVYKCYQTYMAGFNVKMTDTIPEYWVFRNARSALFQKNGKNEENQNCQFTNTLLNCLDNDFECMGQETFITLGASNSTEAVDYWADLLVNQYQCTPQGLKLKLDNFSCYENCRKDHSSEIDKCHSDLFDNMNGEMDVCL